MTADKTQAKVDTLPADLQAVFAALGRGRHFLDLFNVFADHGALLIPRGFRGFTDCKLSKRFAAGANKEALLRFPLEEGAEPMLADGVYQKNAGRAEPPPRRLGFSACARQ